MSRRAAGAEQRLLRNLVEPWPWEGPRFFVEVVGGRHVAVDGMTGEIVCEVEGLSEAVEVARGENRMWEELCG